MFNCRYRSIFTLQICLSNRRMILGQYQTGIIRPPQFRLPLPIPNRCRANIILASHIIRNINCRASGPFHRVFLPFTKINCLCHIRGPTSVPIFNEVRGQRNIRVLLCKIDLSYRVTFRCRTCIINQNNCIDHYIRPTPRDIRNRFYGKLMRTQETHDPMFHPTLCNIRPRVMRSIRRTFSTLIL